MHVLPDSRALGCTCKGPHLHIRRRDNAGGAWSESREGWIQPVDFLVVQAYDQYIDERYELLGAGDSDFLLVSLRCGGGHGGSRDAGGKHQDHPGVGRRHERADVHHEHTTEAGSASAATSRPVASTGVSIRTSG
ncbi:hypothetical protein ACFRCI_18865 [Streptomyces sp. NPDC056638]|uniref:hypothetical protein n=1 Tax=Streptomyces sp. NPDC056638 TaxID=3345887 RepID=UPI003678FC1B